MEQEKQKETKQNGKVENETQRWRENTGDEAIEHDKIGIGIKKC